MIDQLNHLIAVNKDAESSFLAAAGNVKNSELETLFSGYAKQHAKFAVELEEQIDRLDGESADAGTVGGALHQGWMEVKSALTGHSAASLLKSCETGEQSAESAYNEAAKVIDKGQAHTVIAKHCQQIEAFRKRLARLVGETKDGVDFQENT